MNWIVTKYSFHLIRSRKLLSIRLFDDENGKRWQKSAKDLQYEILCVSQFTLYNRLKGNKPDFHLAMQGEQASNLYNSLLQQLGTQYASNKIKGMCSHVGSIECIFMLDFSLHFRRQVWSNDAGTHTE